MSVLILLDWVFPSQDVPFCRGACRGRAVGAVAPADYFVARAEVEWTYAHADFPTAVAKALGPANMKAVSALEPDPATLRALGLPTPDAGPGWANADRMAHGMGAGDSSDEGADSEDLDYSLDAPCTNCTGTVHDGICQVFFRKLSVMAG